MSFLFQHKRRPYQEGKTTKAATAVIDSDPEEEEDLSDGGDFFEDSGKGSSAIGKKRGRPPKHNNNHPLSRSTSLKSHNLESAQKQKKKDHDVLSASTEEIEELPPSKPPTRIIDLDEDSPVKPDNHSSISTSPPYQATTHLIDISDEIVSLPTHFDENDEVAKSILALKSKLLSTKRSLAQSESINLVDAAPHLTTTNVLTASSTISSIHSLTAIQRSYSIPKVLSAAERTELIKQSSLSSQVLGNSSSSHLVNNNSSGDEEDSDQMIITVKTRLHGKDEKTWKLKATSNFQQLYEDVRSGYHLGSEKFSIVFDGEVVDVEEATPEELGLEDDDLLDVKIQVQKKESQPQSLPQPSGKKPKSKK